MLSIGAFARLGQVTHRMLRHWDTEGLLVPAHVDRFSGYRSYDPEQLDQLHRIVALRELGFGIEETSDLLSAGMDDATLRALLSGRREQVEREYALAAGRLRDVERRLSLVDQEKPMSNIEIVKKSLPLVRLAAHRATVTEQVEVAGVVGPALQRIAGLITETGGVPQTPIAQYDMSEAGLSIVVGFEYGGDPLDGCEITELPGVSDAFCGVHLGSMDTIAQSWQSVHSELIARGFEPSGPCRELYVRSESEDQADWVTELQQPVAVA